MEETIESRKYRFSPRKELNPLENPGAEWNTGA
jgi:hypothetical protein